MMDYFREESSLVKGIGSLISGASENPVTKIAQTPGLVPRLLLLVIAVKVLE